MPQSRNTAIRPRDAAGSKLQDAEVRFSEVARRTQTEGRTCVTVRGHDAVVFLAADELARLLASAPGSVPFVVFMEGLSADGLDLTRDFES